MVNFHRWKESQKIFPDGTIGRKVTTADLREFITTYGDDPLTDAEAQELIQVFLTKFLKYSSSKNCLHQNVRRENKESSIFPNK